MHLKSIRSINILKLSLLFLVGSSQLAAQSGDENIILNQSAFSTDGQKYDIDSTMTLSVLDNDFESASINGATIDNYVDLFAEFTFDPSHASTFADFFVAVKVNKNLYMLDSQGELLSWNGSLNSLTPFESAIPINDSHTVVVYFNKFEQADTYRFFTGYKLLGSTVFHVTPTPISLTLADSISSTDGDDDGEGAFPDPPDTQDPEVQPFFLDHLKTFSVLEEGERFEQQFFLSSKPDEDGIWAYSLVRRSDDEAGNYINIYDLENPTDNFKSRREAGCYVRGDEGDAWFLQSDLKDYLVIKTFRGLGSDGSGNSTLNVTLSPTAEKISEVFAETFRFPGNAFATLTTTDSESWGCNGYEEEIIYGNQQGGFGSSLEWSIGNSFLGAFQSQGADSCSTCEKFFPGKPSFTSRPWENYFIVTDGSDIGDGEYVFGVYEYVNYFYGNAHLIGEISARDEDGNIYTEYPLVTSSHGPSDAGFYLDFNAFIDRWHWLGNEITPLINNSAMLITDHVVNYVAFQEDLAEPTIFRQVRFSENDNETVVNTIAKTVIGTDEATYILKGIPEDVQSYIYETDTISQKIDKPGFNLQWVTYGELGIPTGPGVSVNLDNQYLMIGDDNSITIYSRSTSGETTDFGQFIPRYEVDISDQIDGQWHFLNGNIYSRTHDGYSVYEVRFE